MIVYCIRGASPLALHIYSVLEEANSKYYIFVLDIGAEKSTVDVVVFVHHVHQMSYSHALIPEIGRQHTVVHFKCARLSVPCLFQHDESMPFFVLRWL